MPDIIISMVTGIVGNTEWDGLPMPRRLWAIAAVAFGVSLSVIDSVIANVALPTISVELGITSADSVWIVNIYQLAVITTLLVFSNLGDIVGYRRVYIAGLALFTVASAGCALSHGLVPLLLWRAMQGLGAAAVTSVNTTLIRIIYPRRMLARGLGLNATVVAVSSVAGPSIAAAILSVAQWHWLFAVNIPIGLAAFCLSRRFLPHNPVKVEGRRFDWRDGAMCAFTFGMAMGCVEACSHGVRSTYVILIAAVTAFVAWRFVCEQLRRPMPILPFDLLKIPIFSLSIVTSVCSFIAQMLAMVALPFIMQHDLGYDAVSTGLLFTAWPMVIMVVAPAAGMLAERIHAGYMGLAGLLVMTFGLVMLGLLPAAPSHFGLVWRLVVCGMGFGIFQSPNNSIMIASAPQHRSGSASGMLASARLVGQTTGAAMVALLFHLNGGSVTRSGLFVAAGFSLLGAVISASRIRLPLPEGLKRR